MSYPEPTTSANVKGLTPPKKIKPAPKQVVPHPMQVTKK